MLTSAFLESPRASVPVPAGERVPRRGRRPGRVPPPVASAALRPPQRPAAISSDTSPQIRRLDRLKIEARLSSGFARAVAATAHRPGSSPVSAMTRRSRVSPSASRMTPAYRDMCLREPPGARPRSLAPVHGPGCASCRPRLRTGGIPTWRHDRARYAAVCRSQIRYTLPTAPDWRRRTARARGRRGQGVGDGRAGAAAGDDRLGDRVGGEPVRPLHPGRRGLAGRVEPREAGPPVQVGEDAAARVVRARRDRDAARSPGRSRACGTRRLRSGTRFPAGRARARSRRATRAPRRPPR